jgi:hypothetical protein
VGEGAGSTREGEDVGEGLGARPAHPLPTIPRGKRRHAGDGKDIHLQKELIHFGVFFSHYFDNILYNAINEIMLRVNKRHLVQCELI